MFQLKTWKMFSLSPEIEVIWVYGDSFQSFLVGVVIPNKQALESWAESNGIITDDLGSLCQHPRSKGFILDQLNKIAKLNKLKGFESIKAVHLDPVPFDMDRDLLTPTFKKKSPQLLKYYKDIISNLYQGRKGN